MIFGMTTFTFVHVVLSLIGLISGCVVLYGLLTADRMDVWSPIFFVSTLATSITGFGFSFHGFTPGIGVGILSLIALPATITGRYGFSLAGHWRAIYVVGSVMGLYFNVLVLGAQAFAKIPALHALAPNGSEPPFAIAQGAVLVLFIFLGSLSARRFHPDNNIVRHPARSR